MKKFGFVEISSILAILLAFLAGSGSSPASPLGDINKDCSVDWGDVQVFVQQWLSENCGGEFCANFDEFFGINGSDFAILAKNWGKSCDDVRLVINEFQADNETTIADGQGDYDDWVEIYNDSNITADIGGYYITDDFNTPDLNQIPPNRPAQTQIAPHGYGLIWADKDPEDGAMHIGLSLKADGERVGMVAFDGSAFIDSVVFGPQGNDESYGRFPDAEDNWTAFGIPTPGAENFLSDLQELVISNDGDCVVVFNEIMYNHPGDDIHLEWIELYNQMAIDIDLSGWWITDGVKYKFGPGTIIQGGDYIVVASSPTHLQAETGYSDALGPYAGRLSNGGERVRLRDNSGRVMDVVDYNDGGDWPTAPDGTGKTLAKIDPDTASKPAANWTASTQINGTPGADNSLTGTITIPTDTHVLNNIVINEIMYHHQPIWETDVTPFADSNEEWIELYNRSGSTVNITGWRLQGVGEFIFPATTQISGHGYLVVAKDSAALKAKYPAVSSKIIGDFPGGLSNDGERIRLTNGAGAVIDEVRYYDDKPWPEYADGGGSSLELRNPDADNRKPEAWADSNERDKAGWNTYSYRQTAQEDVHDNDGPVDWQLWHEFIMGLLDEGEVLIDDISVVEDPDGSAIEFIQNGSFESGANHWRFGGTHGQCQVITDPDNGGNHVLHLLATGPMENIYNHVETTFDNAEQVVNGTEYEVSFRAKWLAGSPRLNTHLYYNRVAMTNIIEPSQYNGTPAAQNSCYESNIGPTFNYLGHSPVVPNAWQTVTVTAVAKDRDAISFCKLWWRVDGGAWSSATMTNAGSGKYTKTISGKAAGTIVQFYIEAQDGDSFTSYYPPAGADSRALYKVNDGQAATNGLHNFRIIMLSDDYDALNDVTNRYTNAYADHRCTAIYDESKAFYDIGVHFKGSLYTRSNDTPGRRGWKVEFNSDDLFRGVHSVLAIDRASSGWCGNEPTREIFVKHILNHCGGISSQYDDLIKVMPPPDTANYSYAQLQLARFSDQYLESAFTDGGDGMLFKQELVYYPTDTTDGDPESPKRHDTGTAEFVNPPIWDLGDSADNYRGTYFVRSNRARDDYSRLIEMCKMFSLQYETFLAEAEQTLDLDQWLRAYAWTGVVCSFDNYFGSHTPHNHYFYIKPADNKVVFLTWDNDFHFECAGWHPDPYELKRCGKMNNHILNISPKYDRVYWGHIHDIISTTANASYLTYWANHYGTLIPDEDFAHYLDFQVERSDWILTTQLPAAVGFEITTNGGNNFSTSSSSVVIEGTGWINIRQIRVTDRRDIPEFEWLDIETWENTIDLEPGPNLLEFVAYDYQGNQIATDTITVTRN